MVKNKVTIRYVGEGGFIHTREFEDGVVWLSENMVRVRNAERTEALWFRVNDVVRITEARHEAD